MLFSSLLISANAQLRLLSYNLLNFPTGNLAGRADTLANILDYARPHLLMVQELKNEEGLADITDRLNDLGYGDFAHSTFVEQQSPGSPGNLLQQAIVYDTEYLRMKSESVVLTDYRDINEYILYLNDPLLPAGNDTTFLYVYVTHLKSSTGSDNEAARLSMVNYLIQHFESLPSDALVIFAGDFNLYSTAEPAYQAIVSEENNVVLRDVFAGYGDWSGSAFPHKEILTQSTRSTQIFNDGAGGGVDDRFDFILLSDALMNQDNSALHYVEDSFLSLGNTGFCYNQSITDCASGNDLPFDVLQSMYYMSDHIPQYCELSSSLINAVESYDESFDLLDLPAGNMIKTGGALQVRINMASDLEMQVLDLSGRQVFQKGMRGPALQEVELPLLTPGIYLLHACGKNGQSFTEKIIVSE